MIHPAPDAKLIFLEAIEKESPEEISRYLDVACQNEAELRGRVERLLRAHQSAGKFLGGSTTSDPTPDDPFTELPGTVIGPYKLLEQIGEGGFGVVFMAEQVKPIQRKVAVKIIKPGMDTQQVIARFEAERQALALMDHPNIAKVLDAGTTASGRPYFVMELVRGVPVTEFCDQKTASVRDRLELFITICQAVQHAHQKGIIHRDIKPTNVLVTLHDGRPVIKVIDFGVAKATGQKLTDKTLFTGFAQMVGTPLYMSPEQAEMSGLDVDTRSDIYSLGVLLYELLTGMTPFDKDRLKTATFDELRRIIREEEPPRPSTRLSTLAQQAMSTVSTQRSIDPRHLSCLFQGELDWIVMKSLEKDRGRRYEAASALAADVERYLRDEPVQACPPSGLYRVRKFVRRNRVGVAMATAIAIGLLIAVAGAAWVLRDHSAREAALEQEINQALKDSKSSYESDKLAEAMSALKRAEGLLASGGAGDVVQQRVERWRTDLETVDRLEQIRIDQAGRRFSVQPERADSPVFLTSNARMDPIVRRVGSTDANSIQQTESRAEVWDQDTANRAFQQEFEKYGINSGALDIEKAAQLIRNSPIKQALVAALDDWFHATQSDKRTPSGRQELLQIARLVDPDPLRDRLRDAILRGDNVVLTRLATEAGMNEQPLPTVLLLVRALQMRDRESVTSEGAALLRQVQRRHPNDFWINVELANCLPKEQIAEEVVFRRIAVALRPDSRDALFDLADKLRDQGNEEEAKAVYGEALARIRKAIRLSPDDPECSYILGICLRALDMHGEAVAAFREAVRLRPDYYAAQLNRGWSAETAGQLDEAEAAFKQCSRLSPLSAQGPGNLGRVLMKHKKYEEAKAACHEALRRDPNYDPAIWALCEALLAEGKYKELEDRARDVIQRFPKDTWAHLDLARAQQQQAFQKAKDLLQKAKSAGENPRWDDVAADFVRVIELSEDNRYFSSPQKDVCLLIAGCDEVFDRVAKLRPKETSLWVGRGQYRALRGHWHQAASDLARVVRDRRLEDDSTFEYAGVLILDGDLAGYKKFCQEVKVRLDRQPNDPYAACVVARVFAIGPVNAVDAPRVTAWANQAFQAHPEGWVAHVLGLAQYRGAQDEAALENLRKSSGLGFAGSPLNWLVQAMIQTRLGHTEEAHRCIEKAKELIKTAEPSSPGGEARIPCPDWIELNVLRREADKLLKSVPEQASVGPAQNDAVQTTGNKQAE